MKFFANRNIWKKFVIAFLIIWSISFVAPKRVSATSGIGGVLLGPVVNLFVSIADGINTGVQKFFLKQENDAVLKVSIGTKWYEKIGLYFKSGTWDVITGANVARRVDAAYELITNKNKSKGKSIFTLATGMPKSVLEKKDEIDLPFINLSPYEIFANNGGIFSVNIFEKQNDDTIISKMRTIVSGWYNTLRLIAIISMMSVLVYIGIRMVLSSANESKAKYKQMLWDWMVAMALLFVMQYIMVFANVLVESFTDIIDAVKVEADVDDQSGTTQIYTHNGVQGFLIGATGSLANNDLKVDNDSKLLIDRAYEMLADNDEFKDENIKTLFWSDVNGTPAKNKDDAKILFWPTENFTSQARILLQVSEQSDSNKSNYQFIGYAIIYVTLTIYTLIFIFVYVRRLIYMVFLTLISPFVALTYPIDKVGDGQAQAFNFWFKEYVYNLMLQPLHLLIYMILIGMAMQFAVSNPIYVIVCLGFMVPAEKLLKQMFGFKGNTPGAIPGMAAGALMFTGMRNLLNKAPSGGKSSSGGGKEGSSGGDSGNGAPTKISSAKPFENQNLFGNSNGDGGGNDNPNNGGDDSGLNSTGQAYLNYVNDSDNYIQDGRRSAQQLSQHNTTLGNAQGRTQIGGAGGPAAQTLGNRQQANIGQNAQRQNNQQQNDPQRWRRLRAVGNASKRRLASGYNRTIGNGRWWAQKGKNIGKGAFRTTAKVATGVAGAAIPAIAGGMLGIVTGDPSKIREYMFAGGAVGYTLASRKGERLANNVFDSTGNFIDSVKDEYYSGEQGQRERAQKEMDRYIKEWKQTEANMSILSRNRVDDEQFRDLTNGGIDEYINYGFTDAKQIATAERLIRQQLDNGNTNFTRRDAIDVLQMNKQIADGGYAKLNSKSKAEWDETMADKFRENGVPESQISARVQSARSLLQDVNSIQSKLR